MTGMYRIGADLPSTVNGRIGAHAGKGLFSRCASNNTTASYFPDESFEQCMSIFEQKLGGKLVKNYTESCTKMSETITYPFGHL